MNPGQRKILFKLLHAIGQADDASRANIVLGATNGRTDSTSALTWHEADDLIRALRKQVADKGDVMRKKVIAILRSYGMIRLTSQGVRADMPRIYEWVLKYGYLHKPLNDYTVKELPALVSQAEKLLSHAPGKN